MADDRAPQPLRLTTSDGVSLEAESVLPPGAAVAIVLAHPHPLQGGSMRSLVTSELFRTLPEHGFAVVRFNFRGVEGSGGEHGHGVGERLDILAAVDALAAATDPTVLLVVGWSFGADVALTVDDGRLAGWVLIAPPLRSVAPEAMVVAGDPRPKLLIVPERDQFRPPESAAEATAGWTNTRLEVVAGADHFLAGRTDRATELVAAFANEQVSGSGG
jgi:uncharacterized protein